jgi:hypothetical protein
MRVLLQASKRHLICREQGIEQLTNWIHYVGTVENTVHSS